VLLANKLSRRLGRERICSCTDRVDAVFDTARSLHLPQS
jgi:hypothetical protein